LIEAVVRYSNAIRTKTTKIKEDYYKLDWIDRDVPFVLAVSSYAQVNYGKEYYYPMFALLYGLFFDPIPREYFRFEHVPKPGSDALIKVSIFDDPAMQDVSAILFSCTLTLGKLTSLSKSINNSPLNKNTILIIREEYEEPHFWFQEVSEQSPELHSDGLFVFHNPNARVKLPTEVFSRCCALQVELDEEGVLQFIGNREPMFSRINLNSEVLPFDVKKALIEETFELFNRVKLPKKPNT
jgi:hypothetical protein